jgi:F420-0:gamma-glutamyl ligase-like protein
MTEVVTFIIGAFLIVSVGVLGFMAGRDAAERRASATIATLRHTVVKERTEKESLQEANYRLHRSLARLNPKDPQAPEWMTR